MGGERLGEIAVQTPGLQAACLADRQQPLDGAVAVVDLGAVACLAPHDCVPERSLRGVVRGRHARDPGERPERVVALQPSGAEPGGLRVAATGALLEQFAQLLARRGEVGLQRVHVQAVAVWLVEDLERVGEAAPELAAEATGRVGALTKRHEVAQVLTDTQDGYDGAIEDGDLGDERPNDQRGCRLVSGTAAMKAAGSGARGCASRVETASLPL